jgi:hypothetical protein
MELLKFIYLDQEVEFEVTDENVMVNATEMAKIFGKRIDVFLKSDHANEFINVLEFTPFGGNSSPLKREEIIQTKGQSGTWMHRILALKFAAWLDPKFEVWVFTTIDHLINHFFREQRDTLIEIMTIRQKKQAMRKELIEKYPETKEYFDLEQSERKAKKLRKSSFIQQKNQLELQFEPYSQTA